MTNKRKTGERPRVQQPLKIDKLPVEMRDRIQAERGEGRTWEEIEDMSPGFKEWEKVSESALVLFPGKKLPHSSLARWWDLRVAQVRQEVMKQSETAKSLAMAFAGRSMEQLPEAVINALRDTIFSVLEYSDTKNKGKAITALSDLGWLVNDQQRVRLEELKVKSESKRIELLERQFEMKRKRVEDETDKAARKLGKGQQLTVEDINRIRERTFGLPPVQRSAAASHPAA